VKSSTLDRARDRSIPQGHVGPATQIASPPEASGGQHRPTVPTPAHSAHGHVVQNGAVA